jgi:ADP-ribose pyrophosphatase YjhB (NUDIX family)
MHHIQRKILQQLMYAPSLNYAGMRPPGVESNHFAYHLEQLIREKLIVKDGRSYTLTDKGLAFTDRANHETMSPRLQPHIVTSVHITNDQGHMVLYEHLFQPYLNLYGPPQGRLHYAEHVAEAAERELFEKSGLRGVALTHRGMVYIHTTKAGAEVSKILAHILSGTTTGTPELTESQDGTAIWKDPAQLRKNECMPGFMEVRGLLSVHTDSFFFTEIETSML